MSRRANPTAIGLFVLGAIVLGIVGIAALGSSQLFSSRTTFISYFDESVNGLDVGAPVKFKGVPIGQVTDIRLRVDLEDETFQVPVLYEINLDPVTDTTGATLDLSDRELLREQVDEGLRAQLQLESFVTGKLYVELTYVSQPEPPQYAQQEDRYPEVPTELSPLAKLGEEASGLVTSLRSFDVSTINENLVQLLVKANTKLDQLDMAEINRSILATIESVQDLVESDEVRGALRDVPQLTNQLGETLADTRTLVQRLNESVDPTAEELKTTGKELRATLQSMRQTMQKMNESMSTDSGIGYQMQEALANLSEATEALRVLIESLERNPGMFIRGKEEPEPTNEQ